ncbi:hypothetical protein ACFRJ9_00340 [Paenarthrobacter sp. NPDC056912]|uniref:hypothetical protein n=1 Tax=Paenarthrobacter sp. NPDC056912 TaxID=3345965 RepID=UPI00366A779C
MDQQPRPPWRSFPVAPVPAGLVGTAAAGSATAHVLAAVTGPVGVMAWWMGAMGIACLACIAPLMRGRLCGRRAGHDGHARMPAQRAAGHLAAMSAVMILVHMVLLVTPGLLVTHGAGGHHGGTESASSPAHDVTMLTLIAVELVCLMGASAALRLARRGPHRRRALTY